MARFYSKRDASLGKKPGEMVYIGRNPSGSTKLDRISYNTETITEQTDLAIEELADHSSRSISWLNVEGVSDAASIEKIRDFYQLSPLTAADIMHTGTRPKYQKTSYGFFLVLKMLNYDDGMQKIISEQLSILVAEASLVTFQEAEGDVFSAVRERLNDDNSRIRKEGIEYLAYSLIDSVVDNYIRILQTIAERSEDIEEKLLDRPDEDVHKQIIYLKKELIFLSKAIKPVKDAVRQLITESALQIIKYQDFYNDILSNLTHISETIDIYKELLAQQQNVYDTYINNRLNDIMKFLTIFSVIFLPLTLITGIYGTNFDFIPELRLRYGYFYLWGALFLLAGIMIVIFKRKKWF